jgi:carbon-monoxide dehydrogenase large subunit
VADSRALAQDAAELIEVDYDAEEPAAVTAAALDPATPLVWPELGSNRAFAYHLGDKERTDAAFAKAATVSRVDFTNNRLVCNYMEPRSAIGEWRDDENRFVLTTGSQGVHSMQYIVAGVLGVKKNQLRVITPDVGGGFGPKTFVYREHPLVLEAAKRLGRPVKWAGDRTEHFLTDAQGRDNAVKAEMAMDADGRFLALRVHLTANMGAYISQYGPFIPVVGVSMSSGVYDLPAIDINVTAVYTNTCPVDAYRGAGRPEAAFLIEKLADQCARDLGVPAHEIRRRNFIKPGQFPYNTATGRMYDVGEFEVISTPR